MTRPPELEQMAERLRHQRRSMAQNLRRAHRLARNGDRRAADMISNYAQHRTTPSIPNPDRRASLLLRVQEVQQSLVWLREEVNSACAVADIFRQLDEGVTLYTRLAETARH